MVHPQKLKAQWKDLSISVTTAANTDASAVLFPLTSPFVTAGDSSFTNSNGLLSVNNVTVATDCQVLHQVKIARQGINFTSVPWNTCRQYEPSLNFFRPSSLRKDWTIVLQNRANAWYKKKQKTKTNKNNNNNKNNRIGSLSFLTHLDT